MCCLWNDRIKIKEYTERSEELLLLLTFSGGGTRAAAFSYGVLEALADTKISINGKERRLLDEVDGISSVSGGVYTNIKEFRGTIYESHAAIEYLPWKNFGFGLGYNAFFLDIEANGEDYPQIDFVGELTFKYSGLLLYTKLFF